MNSVAVLCSLPAPQVSDFSKFLLCEDFAKTWTWYTCTLIDIPRLETKTDLTALEYHKSDQIATKFLPAWYPVISIPY